MYRSITINLWWELNEAGMWMKYWHIETYGLQHYAFTKQDCVPPLLEILDIRLSNLGFKAQISWQQSVSELTLESSDKCNFSFFWAFCAQALTISRNFRVFSSTFVDKNRHVAPISCCKLWSVSCFNIKLLTWYIHRYGSLSLNSSCKSGGRMSLLLLKQPVVYIKKQVNSRMRTCK